MHTMSVTKTEQKRSSNEKNLKTPVLSFRAPWTENIFGGRRFSKAMTSRDFNGRASQLLRFRISQAYHSEPKHFISNKNKCCVINLCPGVFFESFRRDLNEAKTVYISE